MSDDTSKLADTIQQQAGQCVKCGLCLPHCPTYAMTENECESPRGRIALLDAIAKRQIPLSDKTRLYLDHCLTCRACEAVCPAQVSYGAIIDKGRELMTKQTPSSKTLPALLDFLLKHPSSWRLLASLLWLYQRSGLQYLLRKSGLLKIAGLQRAEALLPAAITRFHWRQFYPATTAKQGQVLLFIGCINQLIDQNTIKAAITLLTAVGYDVHIPFKQPCCGALHQHSGLREQAQIFAAANLKLFRQAAIDKIITMATGCTATLQEYPRRPDSPAIIDINQFLSTINWPQPLALKNLPRRAVLHTPCTLRNVLKQPQAPLQLLRLVPALEIITLPDVTYCCGAAGQYMLQHPVMADNLLEQTLKQIVPLNPDYLITTNIGCALHLQKGLTEKHLKTRVLHPVVLLAGQLSKIPVNS